MAASKQYVWSVSLDDAYPVKKYNVKFFKSVYVQKRKAAERLPDSESSLVIGLLNDKQETTAILFVGCYKDCVKWVNEKFPTR